MVEGLLILFEVNFIGRIKVICFGFRIGKSNKFVCMFWFFRRYILYIKILKIGCIL